jgi:hypothetical protein
MIELFLLIFIFVVGLFFLVHFDLPRFQRDEVSLAAMTEQIKNQAIEEMKETLIDRYGALEFEQKKLQTYEDFYLEFNKIKGIK